APHLEEILAGYAETGGLAEDWRDRIGLHQLFPLLVHALLFGGGYASATRAAVDALLSCSSSTPTSGSLAPRSSTASGSAQASSRVIRSAPASGTVTGPPPGAWLTSRCTLPRVSTSQLPSTAERTVVCPRSPERRSGCAARSAIRAR